MTIDDVNKKKILTLFVPNILRSDMGSNELVDVFNPIEKCYSSQNENLLQVGLKSEIFETTEEIIRN